MKTNLKRKINPTQSKKTDPNVVMELSYIFRGLMELRHDLWAQAGVFRSKNLDAAIKNLDLTLNKIANAQEELRR